ncbi:MAG TPA: hypothetical protein VL990_08185 [Acidobacteriaceae bacterium]|nr:hypothetical protein [Acidobacteriaceae bacterium]
MDANVTRAWTNNPQAIRAWIDVVQGLVTLTATLLGGLWAWSKFIVERGLVPPSQLEISLRKLGTPASSDMLEVEVDVTNKGSSALIICDLRVRLRYLNDDDIITVVDDAGSAAFGRVNFLHAHVVVPRLGSQSQEPAPHATAPLSSGEFWIVKYDTFVQPGVQQRYTFTTLLPGSAIYALARASFRYQMRPSRLQLAILAISRRLGMIQYSLNNITKPHTVEKTFNLREAQPASTLPSSDPRPLRTP